ncbi:AMP-binding enzyme domain-containing protein [Penicillium taxi]|uniref:AMP-binding enzyme domain-containing protein n=1 Tax=Penicillium taxi TaxID=168475 RepID=UPI002545B145|nr:AMP-binding enzyme domain-containing protein [Penicillium taxi]KAJ5898872.1 AMP-binding enzyme domain-containing protein [Penicillium taxi]
MDERIAIIGTACRFPGSANNPSKLWDLLREPKDVVREYPPERLNFSNFYNEDGESHGRTDVQKRSYLLQEDVRLFDAPFFRVNPKEASGMDPQHRILLEVVYEAFEAAGLPLHVVNGSQTSVHVGSMTDDYYTIQARDPDTMDSHAATGLSRSILSNRVSYTFDLKGPSMTIDTACSSSLVALHLAVQSLRKGEATQAVVAGVNLLLDPHWFITESSLHMLSPDSRSRMWDKSANGYARGDGCAAVVLKPLSQAIRDGDYIECIIRETGVNSDGTTNGITMPSPTAQAALIRQTYKNAGLDIVKDRCQYFECHGTGTQAGDPVEARAIRDAFFPSETTSENVPMYCGSIKTIIGHLEGCAGLAGILKASLAVQNKIIPPNMYFNELNPTVKPFYTNLCVPTNAVSWPETNGMPRRASVNSFGFGGTNAHAIIESFDSPPQLPMEPSQNVSSEAKQNEDGLVTPKFVGPFVFSGKTRRSLVNSLKGMLDYLHGSKTLSLDTLSHVLQSKRTHFSHRIAIAASQDRKQLIERLKNQISIEANIPADGYFGVRALNTANLADGPRILGIFTGQGAQAAQMGYKLLRHCALFRDSIRKCEEALAALPEAPEWSLYKELSAPKNQSRVAEAQISQPLCTAIQIALIDLLKAVGVSFAAVVGHSSGEIGAAYAAGILGLSDAMGIAYYRGYVAHIARGPDGNKGGMLAVAMSFTDATELCSEEQFSGRVNVAASNAPSSVTLSGDMDAIKEIKEHLDGRQIQGRELRVDTAYHSPQMLRCSEQYLGYLKNLQIKVQDPTPGCVWFSSVRRNTAILKENLAESHLDSSYWVDNMVQPVLFSEAVEFAVKSSSSPFSLALEVGPHPALKGPVNQTLKPLKIESLPYTGCLERGEGGIDTLSAVIGMVWSYLGHNSVKFCEWRKAFGMNSQVPMLKDLPAYPWDHDQVYWHESRLSHNYRVANQPPHSLLGRPREDLPLEKTWRNIFNLSEMPWIRGHTFQGQVLFPAAGYVTLVTEAAKLFLQDRPLKLLEIRDVAIPKALVIGEDKGVEILFTIRSKISPISAPEGSVLEAKFFAHICPNERVLEKTCSGRLLIHIGKSQPDDLPSKSLSKAELTPLSVERFHRAVSAIGLGYYGPFRALKSVSRSWGHAKGTASWAEKDLEIGCALHPALMDVAFQTGLATFLSTAERAMGSPYLPVKIQRIIIDPNQIYHNASGATNIDIEASMLNSEISAVDVDIGVCVAMEEGNVASIQIEGLTLKAIAEAQESDDRNLFVRSIWDTDTTYGLTAPSVTGLDRRVSVQMSDVYERITLFYMQNLVQQVNTDDLSNAKWYHRELIRFIKSTVVAIREGRYTPSFKKEWLDDSYETIREFQSLYPHDIDVSMLTAVGENLSSVVRGKSEMIEHMLKDGLLSRLYKESGGLTACNEYVAEIMRQISYKHPRIKILEIGAGTGGTTLSVLKSLGSSYSSYTCTDISASFFTGLAEILPEEHTEKVDFKVFNAENPAAGQGFTEGAYDVIIAANVLHATRKLSETVQNARALLRPGGYMIVIEVTGKMLRETGLMGALEGWWLGTGEGRINGPGVDAKEWDDILQRSGFAGIDCISYDHTEVARHSCSVFAAQATNDQFDLLRNPLAYFDLIPESPLLIVGGKTLEVSKSVQQIKKILHRWSSDIQVCDSIDDLDPNKMLPGTFVLCLTELDQAFFSENLTAQRLEILQEMLSTAKNILWVTRERLLEDPYSNMMVGIGRALSVELPHVNIHYLDFEEAGSWDVNFIICQLLRMAFTLSEEQNTQNMLWVQEPEVVIRDGKAMIPRVIQDHAANETLNASRRRISKAVGPDVRIEVACSNDSTATSLVKGDAIEIPDGHIAIDVEFSLALHSKEEAPCFLVAGWQDSKTTVLALSETDSSTVVVPTESSFKLPTGQVCIAETLLSVACSLIVSCVLSRLPERCRQYSHKKRGKVLFVEFSAAEGKERSEYLIVHPHASVRSIRKLIPSDAFTLLSFSNENLGTISNCLPRCCIVQEFNPLHILQQQPTTIATAIRDGYHDYEAPVKPVTVISIQSASEALFTDRKRLSVVLDWKRDGLLNTLIPPLRASSVFSPNKTYFLAGMAGELGQSLCRFMIRGGARYIVLGSRNPAKDPHWVEELRSDGADIRIVKVDVTDREQVRETVAMLRKTMPKIGGVANAALVFEAGIFANFSADNVTRQLRPKVDGSVNLDQEFESDSLDFFLTFGSLATVCGNPGQAMYHAGNLFMASLVEKRRRRGQAASILNFGLLVDVGYVARTDRADGSDIEGTLRSLLLTPLSEAEFHHVVLQGILYGHPSSPSGEVIMGMEPYIDDGKATARPPWVDKAFFSHMIHTPVASEGSKPLTAGSSSMQHFREELFRAKGIDEVTVAVQEMFFKKIELMIMVSRAAIDLQSPMADLGLDSLHAIEIRNWLLKNMQIQFPLLRILGLESLSSICASVAQLFMDGRPSEDLQTEPVSQTQSLDAQPTSQTTATEPKPQLGKLIVQAQSDYLDSASTSPDTAGATSESMTSSISSIVSPNIPDFEFQLPSSEKSPLALEYKRIERLSFAQAGIHFLHTFLEDPTTFNVTTQYTIRGQLNIKRLLRAIEKVLAHHEIYQSCFFADPGSPEIKHHVARNGELKRVTQISSTAAEAEEHAQIVYDKVAGSGYQLATGESFRAVILSHNVDWHTAVFGFHLLASDAFSFSIFLRNLDCAYQMLPLSPKTGSFLDFAVQQHDALDSGRLDSCITYWKNQLSPLPTDLPLLPLTHVQNRRPRRTYRNHVIERELSSDLVLRVKESSRKLGGTSMQFYLATFQVLLAQLTDSEDICIGVTDSGRGGTGEFAEVIGHFANILPMRFNTKSGQSFSELLSKTSRIVLNAFENAQVPFDVILEKLGISRSPSITPLFQVAFNYRVGDILQRPLGDCSMVMERYTDVKTPYDLTINVTQTAAGGNMLECITADSLYSLEATDMIMETFSGLLESLTEDQSVKIEDCKLFKSTQLESGMILGRGAAVDHTWPKTLSERFQQVLSAFPDSVAIKDSDECLTYDQFSRRVGLYAATLIEAGIKQGSRVAVLCEPSVDMYSMMLANLHTGAVHIPLDISLPAARRQAMIDACQPNALVFHTATEKAANEHCNEARFLTLNLSTLSQSQDSVLVPEYELITAKEESFILFTSGSTGTPKGIRLDQEGIMNYAASKQAHLNLGQVKVLQQSSAGFDMAIAQAFNAFANGGTLVVVPLQARGDPSIISEIMLREKIDLTLATPSEYQMLATFAADTLRKCTSWRHVCSGGEAVTEVLLDKMRRLDLPDLMVTDCYGPTEISCATTFQSTSLLAVSDESGALKSVGKAIPNTFIYIMSEKDNTVLPVGMPGEICVGGAGVARGYLDADLSREKFVKNPFATAEDLASGWNLMYKTGDKGILQKDGSLIFLGRTDGGGAVIKLRGLRIDLTEVSGAVLKAAPEDLLADAAVTVRGEPQYLVCHVVMTQGKHLEQAELNALLPKVELPRYMIPSTIVPLERLPTTANGKLDRASLQMLPLPTSADDGNAHGSRALTVPEGELRVIWLKVLGEAASSTSIGPDSDFFTVGGSSLLLVHLQNALREQIGVALTLQELYQSTTLKGMASAMHKERGQLSEDMIDWDVETSIPNWVQDAFEDSSSYPVAQQQRQVLLTGATTFLGGEILRQLINCDDVSRIHCIGVLNDERKKLPLEDKGKIVVYAGSILSPTLGLSSTEIAFLQANITQIVHATVQGHCMNNFSTVKQALYVSTQSLVGLIASRRRIPFHLISAPRVILLSGKTEGLPVSMSAHYPPVNGSQGVTASKWASERFLENISQDLGLPVTIHRHCALIGERAPADDVMNSVVRFSILTRKVPSISSAEGFFDFKDVVEVASEIVAQQPAIADCVTYVHHSSGIRVPFNQFAQRLQELHGGEFELVAPAKWLNTSATCGMPELLQIHLLANMESGQPMLLPYLGSE